MMTLINLKQSHAFYIIINSRKKIQFDVTFAIYAKITPNQLIAILFVPCLTRTGMFFSYQKRSPGNMRDETRIFSKSLTAPAQFIL